jgi:hypothetical protein
MRALFGIAVVAGIGCCLGACASSVADGVARAVALAEGQFRDGRYPEAKETLGSIDPPCAGDGLRARYALYRGLTLVALGDRGRGNAWLREAWALERDHRGTLSERDVQRLRIAVEANDLP